MGERGGRAWEVLLKVKEWNSDYVSVDKLLRHLARKTRSEGSRATYLKTLAQFVRFTEVAPDDLVALSKEEVEEKVQDFCDSAKAPRTANRKMEELKAFFRCNGFRTGNKCNLILERHYVGARQRSRREYIPTNEEIYRVINEAGLNLKWRAFVLVLYTTGFRNSTARALRYGDIKEELKGDVVPLCVKVYPEMKDVVSDACKNKIPYFGFIPKETVEAVQAYLEERQTRLAPLKDEQVLFCSDNRRIPREKRPYSPLDMTSPQKVIRRAGKVTKIKEWQYVTPHSLRKAFERAVRNSGLDTKDQEFLMGHILPGSQDTYYDKTKVEDLRRKYAQVNFFPERVYSDEDFRKRQVLDTVKLLGFPEDRIKRIEEALAKYEHVDEALEEIKKLSLGSYKENDKGNREADCNGEGNCGKHEIRIIQGEQKLIEFLNGNWNLVKELSNNRFVLRKGTRSD